MYKKTNWIKIRNDYINGNDSYRELADKYKVSYQRICQVGSKEGWVEKRIEQHKKISVVTEQKTIEKIAEKQADLQSRFLDIGNKLLDKIEASINQSQQVVVNDKRRYVTYAIDPQTGKETKVDMEETVPRSRETGKINKSDLKQIASALKDLKDILTNKDEEKAESPNINILIEPKTENDNSTNEDFE